MSCWTSTSTSTCPPKKGKTQSQREKRERLIVWWRMCDSEWRHAELSQLGYVWELVCSEGLIENSCCCLLTVDLILFEHGTVLKSKLTFKLLSKEKLHIYTNSINVVPFIAAFTSDFAWRDQHLKFLLQSYDQVPPPAQLMTDHRPSSNRLTLKLKRRLPNISLTEPVIDLITPNTRAFPFKLIHIHLTCTRDAPSTQISKVLSKKKRF